MLSQFRQPALPAYLQCETQGPRTWGRHCFPISRSAEASNEPPCQPARLMALGQHMYLRGRTGLSTSRYVDYHLALAAGIILGAYAGFAFGLHWLMQPSVSTNSGLAGYRPPPKTVLHSADSPWIPPDPSEAPPIRAVTEPGPETAPKGTTEEPKVTKKETKKQAARTIPRRARSVRGQPNPFWGYASSRSFGSRPWF